MKTQKLTTVFLIRQKYLLAILASLILFTASASFGQDGSGSKTAQPVAAASVPAIYKYILDSDYVVVVTNRASRPIGLETKCVPLNVSDWMVGSVYEFQIDEMLYSRALFQAGKRLDTDSIRSLEIFTTSKGYRESFVPSEKSLLFLKEIPADNPEFDGLEIDKTTKYYRVYSGAQGESIFPGPGDPMHGKNPVGRINLANKEKEELVEEIEALCSALSAGTRQQVLINLRNLADSTDDEVVKANALFAIQDLEKQGLYNLPVGGHVKGEARNN